MATVTCLNLVHLQTLLIDVKVCVIVTSLTVYRYVVEGRRRVSQLYARTFDTGVTSAFRCGECSARRGM